MIQVEDLHKQFGAVQAVDGVSFHVREGEIYGLLGPNGAGKTTTISMVCGLLRPDSGRVLVADIDVAAQPERAKSLMGVVPQETAIYEDLSARENVSFWARLYDIAGAERHRAVAAALDLVGLAASDRRAVKKFSGGMKRRLNLAMGLVHNPRILLLDEPTVGIDPQGRLKILEVVRQVASEGTTVLYTTHYLEEADDLCERIGIVDHGKILAEGTPAELRRMVGEGTEVTLRGSFTAGAVREQLGGLDGLRVLAVEDGKAVVSVPGERGAVTQVLAELMRKEVALDEIGVREPSLQSVFLHLTGRELRD
jgi:ABC-2 type transport system ATP-binding protein